MGDRTRARCLASVFWSPGGDQVGCMKGDFKKEINEGGGGKTRDEAWEETQLVSRV